MHHRPVLLPPRELPPPRRAAANLPAISAGLRLGATALLMLAALMVLPVAASTPGFPAGVLVVTPDRGFLGNEEVRDAFEQFARDRNAVLLFVTDARSEKILDRKLAQLERGGARYIEVLPLVMSAADARWKLADGWLQARRQRGVSLAVSRPYGTSYLAVEDLSARLRDVHTDKRRLLLVGYGAGDAADADTMRAQLKRMAGFASTLPTAAIDAVVHPARHAEGYDALRKRAIDAISGAHDALVVPVAFAPRDDSMMAFENGFAGDLPGDAQMISSPIAGSDALAQWMQLAANETAQRFAPVNASQVGVVALAHGADWFWNHDMEQALAPVVARHKLAFAFSMADRVVVERAVRKLERQHVRAIVVVRTFGMAASFLPMVQRMLGADVEQATADHAGHAMAYHGEGGMHGMHHGGHGGSLAAPPRIRTALPMVTVGGVEDDPLLAKALLQNARAVSRDPSRETVIVMAHGQGDDAANQRWLDLLESLTTQMRADGGDDFRAILHAAWREDWPDKRRIAVAHVRDMVREASRNGGRALIVPARTNGHGAADQYLEGLDFGWSRNGFAQTPYLAEWFEQEIGRGIARLAADEAAQTATAH